ncbi:acetoin reductase family protein [Mycena epipterygia]|nr:acetoin reductase family protein [Mycena epipterygia]
MAFKGAALVTGAGQGIGKGIALRLAKDGFDVAVNDIPANAENLSKVVDEIKSTGRASSAHIADVSVEGEVKAMVEEVVRVYGGLDVMVANAGVCKFSRIIDTTADDWDRVMSINARGTFLCYKYAGLEMISQGRGGRIIGASSLSGKRGGAAVSAYSASKFAIRGLTQAAALEFGSHGITVNAYAPGTIDTPMLEYLDQAHAQVTGSAVGTLTQGLKARAALSMTATPEDIAGLVSYIASKESQFITGQSISIDGGMFFD